MNLVKRLFKHRNDDEHDGRRGTALAQREGGGGGSLLRRKRPYGFDRAFDDLWRDFDRDPWDFVRDPWSMLDHVHDRLGGLAPAAANWPAVDVSEDDRSITVRCDVPGLDANDLDVQVSGNLLTVSGHRDDEWTDNQRGVRRRERVSGSFSRTITLPAYVDASALDARYDKGTLTLTAPKIPGKSPRRVTVQTG